MTWYVNKSSDIILWQLLMAYVNMISCRIDLKFISTKPFERHASDIVPYITRSIGGRMTYELTWASCDRKPQDKINTIPSEVFRELLVTHGTEDILNVSIRFASFASFSFGKKVSFD